MDIEIVGGVIECIGEFISLLICSPSVSNTCSSIQFHRKTIVSKSQATNIHSIDQLRLWEDFISDGREIASIAQIIECNDKFQGFPENALDFLHHTMRIDMKDFYDKKKDIHTNKVLREEYMKRFIMELFEYHAKLKGIRTCEAVELWLIKLNKVFPEDSIKCIHEMYRATEWDWEW